VRSAAGPERGGDRPRVRSDVHSSRKLLRATRRRCHAPDRDEVVETKENHVSGRRRRTVLAAVVLSVATSLVPLPADRAGAADAAACTWLKTAWELPTGADVGTTFGYDGRRYAVGVTGRWRNFTTTDPRGTLWDDGRVVLRLAGSTPRLADVNASGLIVGDAFADDRRIAVTVGHDGGTTALPRDPAWDSSSADLVNNAGDVVGIADAGLRRTVVVWPAAAPGTYRELPTPDVDFLDLTDVDEQGRIVAVTDSGSGGGFVWDTDGRWRPLVAPGAGGHSTPWAVRDGRVVGSADDGTGPAAGEWNARGALVRTIRGGAIQAKAIGGRGTVGGTAFVNSVPRAVLWRGGVVADPLSAVPADFALRGISDDESTLVGSSGLRPAQYRCS
jgi:hypothetical protein